MTKSLIKDPSFVQEKRLDALNTMQNTSALYKVAFLKT